MCLLTPYLKLYNLKAASQSPPIKVHHLPWRLQCLSKVYANSCKLLCYVQHPGDVPWPGHLCDVLLNLHHSCGYQDELWSIFNPAKEPTDAQRVNPITFSAYCARSAISTLWVQVCISCDSLKLKHLPGSTLSPCQPKQCKLSDMKRWWGCSKQACLEVLVHNAESLWSRNKSH